MAVTHHLAAPIATQLPELKPDTYFSETQWKVLFALIDAIVPSIVAESRVTDRKTQLSIPDSQYKEAHEKTMKCMIHPPDYEDFQQYLEARSIDNPRFVQLVKRNVQEVSNTDRKKLGVILNIISTRLGSLAASGQFTLLHEQPVHIREAVIQSWGKSWINVWPSLKKAVLLVGRVGYATTNPLFHKLIDFKDSPEDYRPGPSFDFDFMQFEAGDELETVETDVVVVGSGCGGGVCAKALAEAGHRVIVVDKGYHFPTSHLPMTSEAANQYLFDGNGSIQSADGSIIVFVSSCWGGGGTVNWSCSLQLQGYVRQEWADEGLGLFTTQEFQNCLDRVCEFMGVSDAHIRHNHGSKLILGGSRKLGYAAKTCPQNTGGAEHYCGRCGSGCGAGEKQGPAVSWLPAAAKAGANFIEGFDASKVLFKEARGPKQATGIIGTWTSRSKDGSLHAPESDRIQRKLQIKAKKVIIACGTVNSPLVLMRSGLKNHHIGRNLHMHPVSQLNASFDEDVKGWEGSILTGICTNFENLDGKGHGPKLMPTNMNPFMFLYEHPWRNALQWKTDALRCRQMNSYLSLTRDRDTGRVYPDPDDGRPIIDYHPSAFDRKHILAGIIALAKICYIEGATEIWPFIQSLPSFVRQPKTANGTATTGSENIDIDQGINDPEFVAWIKKLQKTGIQFPDASFASAHQMGTCRMSARPSDGVVDAKGEVWGTQGLYVADASVFPSASGANPMVTIMAIADWIARGISRDLKK
ncbi:long-chain fatty alcohol dehydrogenase [Hypoxylon trugodes]|uniref:long-chain fatty alcohol dehydrogenase n=1 Tax=Hypoxylon trugodes TaxID=326681 RepID=UPI00219CE02A|nr:long-chain fatty alcohol dehydrogenase [Hypoxylon trugodes]KAI1393693.1 long-chain fatty alcohol dehydrogenase [Hypoxylon trugodes]